MVSTFNNGKLFWTLGRIEEPTHSFEWYTSISPSSHDEEGARRNFIDFINRIVDSVIDR